MATRRPSPFERLPIQPVVDVDLALAADSLRDATRLRMAAPVQLLHDPPSVAFSDSVRRPLDAFDAATRMLLREDAQWQPSSTSAGCMIIANTDRTYRDARAVYASAIGHARGWQPRATPAANDAAIAVVFGRWNAALTQLCSSFTAVSVDLSRCTGMTTIGADFAAGCRSLRQVVLPDTVTKIEAEAFKDATSLEELDLLHCTDLTAIPADCVRGCTALRRVELPPSITAIGNAAFNNAANLAQLDMSRCTALRLIGYRAFAGCTALRSVVLPERVATVGWSAFEGMTSLTELDACRCTTLTIVPDYFAASCTALERVALPSTVTTIGIRAFHTAARLEKLDVSHCDALTTIGFEATACCVALRTVSLPDAMIESIESCCWAEYSEDQDVFDEAVGPVFTAGFATLRRQGSEIGTAASATGAQITAHSVHHRHATRACVAGAMV